MKPPKDENSGKPPKQPKTCYWDDSLEVIGFFKCLASQRPGCGCGNKKYHPITRKKEKLD